MGLRKNIGPAGQIFRLLMGIMLLGYSLWKMSWIALFFALFTFFEASMSWCVIYQLLGKNNCPIKKR